MSWQAGYYQNNYQVLECKGTEVADFLHRITTNNIDNLAQGEGRRTIALTEKARIVDILTVLRHEQLWWVIPSPGRAELLFQHLRKYIVIEDVHLHWHDENMSAIEVWSNGPLTDAPNDVLPVGTFPVQCGAWRWVDLGGVQCIGIRMHAMDCCPTTRGEMLLLLCPSHKQDTVIEWLKCAGIDRLSYAEREYLRIMSRIGSVPSEYNETVNPLEAGLAHMISFHKGCYIGQEVIERLVVQQKVKQKLYDFHALQSANTLTLGAPLYGQPDDQQEAIGRITSVQQDLANSDTVIGLCYVRTGGGAQLWTKDGVAVYLGAPVGSYN